MLNLDEKIKELLDKGKSIRKIASELDIGTKIVRKVKSQGKYYINLETKEIIFSAKKISEEQQITNMLRDVSTKQLSEALGVSYRNIDIWKQHPPLVLYTDGEIDKGLLERARYLHNHLSPIKQRMFRKKGMGLYFLYQNDELMYIGKSKYLGTRLYQHEHYSHKDLKGKYDVKLIEVENELDLDLMERIYIQMLNSPLNIDFRTDKEMGEVFKPLLELIPSEYSMQIEV